MPNKLSQFWHELKRRKVVRVITVYAGASFVIIELINNITEPLRLPDWTPTLVIVLLAIGFPIVFIFSWIYDVKPEGGIVKTELVDKVSTEEIPKSSKGWKIASYISILVIVAFAVFYLAGNNKKPIDISKLEKSIAVLPLGYLSEDPNKEYLANGVLDAITGNLSLIKGLRVMPRTSVEQYRENTKSAKEIGEELDVSYLIEGSFLMVGDQVKLTIQLVVAEQGDHVFFKAYDRNYKDIISVTSEVAKTIAKEIEVAITPEAKQRIETLPTKNTEAYKYYWRARDFYNKYFDGNNEANLRSAIMFFTKAIDLDPEFALAYVWLGLAKNSQTFQNNYLKEGYGDSLLWYAEKALELNPELPDGFHMKGFYSFFKNDMDSAIINLEKAITLDPNRGDSYFLLGSIYWDQNYVSCISNLMKAKKLLVGDPEYYEGLLYNLGLIYHNICATTKSEEAFLELVEYDPSLGYECLIWLARSMGDQTKCDYYINQVCALDSGKACWSGLAAMYSNSNDFDDALHYQELYVNELQRIESGRQNLQLDRMGYILWNLGRQEEAMQYFEKHIEFCNESIELKKLYPIFEVPYYDLAGIYAFLGDQEMAFQYLHNLEESNFPGTHLLYIRIDPLFESLRGDEEFKAILQRQEKKYAEIRAEIDKLSEL